MSLTTELREVISTLAGDIAKHRDEIARLKEQHAAAIKRLEAAVVAEQKSRVVSKG